MRGGWGRCKFFLFACCCELGGSEANFGPRYQVTIERVRTRTVACGEVVRENFGKVATSDRVRAVGKFIVERARGKLGAVVLFLLMSMVLPGFGWLWMLLGYFLLSRRACRGHCCGRKCCVVTRGG